MGLEQKSSCQSYGRSLISPGGVFASAAGSGIARARVGLRAPETSCVFTIERVAVAEPRVAPVTPTRATKAQETDIVHACESGGTCGRDEVK